MWLDWAEADTGNGVIAGWPAVDLGHDSELEEQPSHSMYAEMDFCGGHGAAAARSKGIRSGCLVFLLKEEPIQFFISGTNVQELQASLSQSSQV